MAQDKQFSTDYLMWFDDRRGVTSEQRIKDAIEAYALRYHIKPNVALVNASEMATVDGITVRASSLARPCIVWVGVE